MSRQGIVLVGNLIVDHIKLCDRYPQEEHLALIQSTITSNGGDQLNVGFDLRGLGYSQPISIVGCVGNDSSASFLEKQCEIKNIHFDSDHIHNPTSFTDVYVSDTSGKRTFFHNPGANNHFYLTELAATYHAYKHLHYGYLNLMAQMDAIVEGDTGASQLLRSAQKAGLTTSVDLVSSHTSTYVGTVKAALPYIDILFCNEVELAQLIHESIIEGDEASQKRYYTHLAALGFTGTLVVHTQYWAAHAMQKDFYHQPALVVPKLNIKSNSGAGDAFAAGYLFQYLQGANAQTALLSGTYAAASCLLSITCSDGILPYDEAVKTFAELSFYHNEQPL